ncbi:GDA1/CD39 nucleoside phosphatase family protein, putative isoform 2 [Hibiscus syriacus]|uniref:apyrase n=1 Tax=Hibiscus syriacus TaxID=106335 RepID=A0A6A3CZR3_HIBSY|nr:GDA1/CD39 nucleoside phosphatase family protein, putative isoform 2 [Hibiscus syriacus]
MPETGLNPNRNRPPTPRKMDTIKLQIRSNSRSTALFPRNPRQTRPFPSFIAVSMAISLALFAFVYIFFFSSKDCVKYSIIIDGGRTRIHVFRYRVDGHRNSIFDFKEGLESLKVNPGLSAYAEDLEGVADSLEELLEFGRRKVPKNQWGETEIRLMATAGLRLLDDEVQERIMEQCRMVLRVVLSSPTSGLPLLQALMREYMLGLLQTMSSVTSFPSETMPSEFSHSIKFGNFTYSLYSHIFLHFGQNVAQLLRESLIKGDFSPAAESIHEEMYTDPCKPKGYLPGSSKLSLGSMAEKSKNISEFQAMGNFSECRSAALMLLQKGKEKCSYDRCYLGRTQSFDEEDLLCYSFSSAYIVALLHDSLEIALDDERISFANQVNDIPLDWALGAFILQSTTNTAVHHADWIAHIIDTDSTLLSVIGFSVILMLTAWSISKWRKPQLKTMYDLEKEERVLVLMLPWLLVPHLKGIIMAQWEM